MIQRGVHHAIQHFRGSRHVQSEFASHDADRTRSRHQAASIGIYVYVDDEAGSFGTARSSRSSTKGKVSA